MLPTYRRFGHRAIAAKARRDAHAAQGGSKHPEALESLEAFWRLVMHDKPPQPHHQEWIKLIQTGQDSGAIAMVAGDGLEILGPRDSAKSTFAVVACAWIIGWNPGMRLLYISYSESVALEQSRKIKRLVRSPLYREVFPWIRMGGRNNEGEWEIDKAHALSYRDKPARVRINPGADIDATYTLFAQGVLGSIMSKRADLIWCDDLIKSKEAIDSPEVRKKMLDNLDGVIGPCLVNGGRWLDVGMLARAGDVHHTFFTEANGFAVHSTSAVQVNADGQEVSYWETRHPLEALQKKRDRAPHIFKLQYQNELQSDEDLYLVHPDWIKWGDAPDIGAFDQLVIGLDLAATEKEESDFTALVLFGHMRSPLRYWCLGAWLFKESGNLGKLRKISELREELKRPFRLIFEKGAYQNSFEGDLRDYRQREDVKLQRCPAKGVASTKDLRARVTGVTGAIENGYVSFANGGVGLHQVVYQLTTLHDDALEHDDAASAFALGLQYLQGRGEGVAWTA